MLQFWVIDHVFWNFLVINLINKITRKIKNKNFNSSKKKKLSFSKKCTEWVNWRRDLLRRPGDFYRPWHKLAKAIAFREGDQTNIFLIESICHTKHRSSLLDRSLPESFFIFWWWITDRLPTGFKLYAITQRNACLRVYHLIFSLFYAIPKIKMRHYCTNKDKEEIKRGKKKRRLKEEKRNSCTLYFKSLTFLLDRRSV